MLGKYWVPSREIIVQSIKKEFLYSAMTYGYDIIIDNMNLNLSEVKFIEDLVYNWNNPKGIIPSIVRCVYKVEIKDFKTPLEICIERVSKRPNPIGEGIIRNIYKKYKDIIK